MNTLSSFLKTAHARACSQEALMLEQAAKKAMGALQWRLAAELYTQAADCLPKDPHTGGDTIQAQAHRRAAANCTALSKTRTPSQLIKDAPDYGHMTRAAIAEHDAEWKGYGR